MVRRWPDSSMLVRLPGCQARVKAPWLTPVSPKGRGGIPSSSSSSQPSSGGCGRGFSLGLGLALGLSAVSSRSSKASLRTRPSAAMAMAATSEAPEAVSLRCLVSQCVDLAQRAGALIRGISEKAATEEGREALRLHDKGTGTGNFDPQTVADRQAQRCVVENLRALYGASLRVAWALVQACFSVYYTGSRTRTLLF